MARGSIASIWWRAWQRSNEIAAHTFLTLVILLCIFVLQKINLWLEPPEGVVVFDRFRLSVLLDLVDVIMVVYFAWNFFVILGKEEE